MTLRAEEREIVREWLVELTWQMEALSHRIGALTQMFVEEDSPSDGPPPPDR